MSYDLGTAHGKIVLDYNGEKAVAKAENDIDKLYKKATKGDGAMRKLGTSLKVLGKGTALAGLAASLTNAAIQAAAMGVQIAGMIPQLVSIGSLAAGLPAFFAAGVAAVGVLKASLAGVGDAIKAAFDPESAAKFNEALKKLSPAAQDFAKGIRAIAPLLRDFQQGLQEAFFRGADLTDVLPRVRGILDQLRGPLQGLATDFGNVARRIADFATEGESVDFVSEAVGALRSAINDLFPAFTPLLQGLRDVGFVGLPLLRDMGSAVGGVASKFGTWLSEIAADGRLEEWIDTALNTLGTLGGIAQNVGSILKSVFQAAGETGGGLLNSLQEITGEFARFLDSAEGSAAIRSLFTGIGEAAKALAPIFTTLVGALAGALGPALKQLATDVGPVLLQVVQALSPAFAPLAQAIADVASAIAPALPGIAQLVAQLVILGAGVLSTLAQALTPVIGLIGQALSGALTALAPVLDQIIAQLPAFAAAGLQIAQALAPLVPSIIEFASALTSALLPYLPQLMQSFIQLVPPLVQLAQLFASQLGPALERIIPYLPMIIGGMVSLQGTILLMVGAGLRLVNFIVQVGQAFQELPSRISGAVSAFKTAVSNGFNAIIALAQNFPYRVGQAIGVLLTILINVGRNAWNGLRNAFNAGISAAVNLALTLPRRVRSAVNSLISLLGSVARSAWNALRSAFSGGVSGAASTAGTLPRRILSAVGNLGSLLVGAGRDAIRGLVNGIKGAIGSAVSAAADAGRAVISGIKSTLKISSPSRVMVSIGRFVTQGLVKGLTGTANQVRAASIKLGNMVNDAFRDRVVSRGARNTVINTLNAGTKHLVTLVNRANTVTAKLKVAQKNLAAIQKKYADTYNTAVQKTKDSFSLIGEGQAAGDVNDAKERFKIAVKQAQDFAVDIEKLRKRGLKQDLIGQLLAAGPEAAGAMADALANADEQTIREFVQLQNNMNRAAASIGNTAVDTMYGAGLKAAQGLVDGLKSQQKSIEAQMLKIAKSMEAAIKKALKIKSPSRLMFNLGKFTAEGLKLGIESLRRQVESAAQSLARATIMPTVRLTASQTPVAVARNVFAASPQQPNHAEPRDFGPYNLMLDGGVVASFVVDTITGNPKVVSKAADEGSRQSSWSGSGRKAIG